MKRSLQKDLELPAEDVSAYRPNWTRLALAIGFVLVVGVPWWFMADLFQTPPDVRASIESYERLSQSYRTNQSEWTQKKDQIVASMQRHLGNQDISKAALAFDDLSLEVPLAFLEDDLGLVADSTFTLYPTAETDELTFLLTKVDPGLWPFNVILSLEVGLNTEGGAIYPRIHSLRRGARKLDTALAPTLFAQEFNKLRGLERFAGGVQNLMLFKAKIGEEEALHLSWKYQHRSFARN